MIKSLRYKRSTQFLLGAAAMVGLIFPPAPSSAAFVASPDLTQTLANWGFDDDGGGGKDSFDAATTWTDGSAADVAAKGFTNLAPANDVNIRVLTNTSGGVLHLNNGEGTTNESSVVRTQYNLGSTRAAGFIQTSLALVNSGVSVLDVTLRNGTTNLAQIHLFVQTTTAANQNYFTTGSGNTDIGTNGSSFNAFNATSRVMQLAWSDNKVSLFVDGSAFDVTLTDQDFIGGSQLDPDNVHFQFVGGASGATGQPTTQAKAAYIGEFTVKVPEPSAAALLLLGAFGLTARCRSRRA